MNFCFPQGKPEDYFVLILEGRAEVIVGSENLIFEAGPFTSFGMKALGFIDNGPYSFHLHKSLTHVIVKRGVSTVFACFQNFLTPDI